MSKTVTLRIDDASYKLFSQRAEIERRSLSNYIELAAINYATLSVFTDELETSEILSDRPLLRRLKEGSRQAKMQRGRFVS